MMMEGPSRPSPPDSNESGTLGHNKAQIERPEDKIIDRKIEQLREIVIDNTEVSLEVASRKANECLDCWKTFCSWLERGPASEVLANNLAKLYEITATHLLSGEWYGAITKDNSKNYDRMTQELKSCVTTVASETPENETYGLEPKSLMKLQSAIEKDPWKVSYIQDIWAKKDCKAIENGVKELIIRENQCMIRIRMGNLLRLKMFKETLRIADSIYTVFECRASDESVHDKFYSDVNLINYVASSMYEKQKYDKEMKKYLKKHALNSQVPCEVQLPRQKLLSLPLACEALERLKEKNYCDCMVLSNWRGWDEAYETVTTIVVNTVLFKPACGENPGHIGFLHTIFRHWLTVYSNKLDHANSPAKIFWDRTDISSYYAYTLAAVLIMDSDDDETYFCRAIELYVQALNCDINDLAKIEVDVNLKNQTDEWKNKRRVLSTRYYKLADILKENRRLRKWALVTAFSLDPSESLLQDLFSKESQLTEDEENERYDCVNVVHQGKSIALDPVLRHDLISVLENPREKQFSWFMKKPEELKQLCDHYYKTGGRELLKKEDLKHLVVERTENRPSGSGSGAEDYYEEGYEPKGRLRHFNRWSKRKQMQLLQKNSAATVLKPKQTKMPGISRAKKENRKAAPALQINSKYKRHFPVSNPRRNNSSKVMRNTSISSHQKCRKLSDQSNTSCVYGKRLKPKLKPELEYDFVELPSLAVGCIGMEKFLPEVVSVEPSAQPFKAKLDFSEELFLDVFSRPTTVVASHDLDRKRIYQLGSDTFNSKFLKGVSAFSLSAISKTIRDDLTTSPGSPKCLSAAIQRELQDKFIRAVQNGEILVKAIHHLNRKCLVELDHNLPETLVSDCFESMALDALIEAIKNALTTYESACKGQAKQSDNQANAPGSRNLCIREGGTISKIIEEKIKECSSIQENPWKSSFCRPKNYLKLKNEQPIQKKPGPRSVTSRQYEAAIVEKANNNVQSNLLLKKLALGLEFVDGKLVRASPLPPVTVPENFNKPLHFSVPNLDPMVATTSNIDVKEVSKDSMPVVPACRVNLVHFPIDDILQGYCQSAKFNAAETTANVPHLESEVKKSISENGALHYPEGLCCQHDPTMSKVLEIAEIVFGIPATQEKAQNQQECEEHKKKGMAKFLQDHILKRPVVCLERLSQHSLTKQSRKSSVITSVNRKSVDSNVRELKGGFGADGNSQIEDQATSDMSKPPESFNNTHKEELQISPDLGFNCHKLLASTASCQTEVMLPQDWMLKQNEMPNLYGSTLNNYGLGTVDSITPTETGRCTVEDLHEFSPEDVSTSTPLFTKMTDRANIHFNLLSHPDLFDVEGQMQKQTHVSVITHSGNSAYTPNGLLHGLHTVSDKEDSSVSFELLHANAKVKEDNLDVGTSLGSVLSEALNVTFDDSETVFSDIASQNNHSNNGALHRINELGNLQQTVTLDVTAPTCTSQIDHETHETLTILNVIDESSALYNELSLVNAESETMQNEHDVRDRIDGAETGSCSLPMSQEAENQKKVNDRRQSDGLSKKLEASNILSKSDIKDIVFRACRFSNRETERMQTCRVMLQRHNFDITPMCERLKYRADPKKSEIRDNAIRASSSNEFKDDTNVQSRKVTMKKRKLRRIGPRSRKNCSQPSLRQFKDKKKKVNSSDENSLSPIVVTLNTDSEDECVVVNVSANETGTVSLEVKKSCNESENSETLEVSSTDSVDPITSASEHSSRNSGDIDVQAGIQSFETESQGSHPTLIGSHDFLTVHEVVETMPEGQPHDAQRRSSIYENVQSDTCAVYGLKSNVCSGIECNTEHSEGCFVKNGLPTCISEPKIQPEEVAQCTDVQSKNDDYEETGSEKVHGGYEEAFKKAMTPDDVRDIARNIGRVHRPCITVITVADVESDLGSDPLSLSTESKLDGGHMINRNDIEQIIGDILVEPHIDSSRVEEAIENSITTQIQLEYEMEPVKVSHGMDGKIPSNEEDPDNFDDEVQEVFCDSGAAQVAGGKNNETEEESPQQADEYYEGALSPSLSTHDGEATLTDPLAFPDTSRTIENYDDEVTLIDVVPCGHAVSPARKIGSSRRKISQPIKSIEPNVARVAEISKKKENQPLQKQTKISTNVIESCLPRKLKRRKNSSVREAVASYTRSSSESKSYGFRKRKAINELEKYKEFEVSTCARKARKRTSSEVSYDPGAKVVVQDTMPELKPLGRTTRSGKFLAKHTVADDRREKSEFLDLIEKEYDVIIEPVDDSYSTCQSLNFPVKMPNITTDRTAFPESMNGSSMYRSCNQALGPLPSLQDMTRQSRSTRVTSIDSEEPQVIEILEEDDVTTDEVSEEPTEFSSVVYAGAEPRARSFQCQLDQDLEDMESSEKCIENVEDYPLFYENVQDIDVCPATSEMTPRIPSSVRAVSPDITALVSNHNRNGLRRSLRSTSKASSAGKLVECDSPPVLQQATNALTYPEIITEELDSSSPPMLLPYDK